MRIDHNERSHRTEDFVNGQVSFWVRDAGVPARRRTLPGPIDADVAVVGAGLTGLWTAYYLKAARPELSIAVIEREYAGYGASGRNGGWMSAEPAGQFRRYAKAAGESSAHALQAEMFRAVQESGDVARAEGFGDAVQEGGLLHVATNSAQLSRARAHVRAMHNEGWGKDDVFDLSAGEAAERVSVEGVLGGYWTPHALRVHPARYTFGLAEAVERLGVVIYEGTTATEIRPYRVETDRGAVTARHVVRALEGYTGSIRGQSRRLLPMNSSMVITEPLTDDQMQAVGWHGGGLVGDMAHSFSYMHLTNDRRIAIGGRGVPYNFRSGFDRDGRTAEFAVGLIRSRLTELFPALRDIRLQQTWSGVLGVPRDWCASVTYDRTSGIVTAGGYVGHGLSGTNLAARTVRDLVLERDTELTGLPIVGRHARDWEPEPLRWIGATALYKAYRIADAREYASSSPRTHITARIANVISGR